MRTIYDAIQDANINKMRPFVDNLSGNIYANGSGNIKIPNNAEIDGDLTVNGIIAGSVSLSGNIEVDDIQANGSVNIDGDLSVNGYINGDIDASEITVNDIFVQSGMTIDSIQTTGDTLTITTDSVDLAGDLSVNGAIAGRLDVLGGDANGNVALFHRNSQISDGTFYINQIGSSKLTRLTSEADFHFVTSGSETYTDGTVNLQLSGDTVTVPGVADIATLSTNLVGVGQGIELQGENGGTGDIAKFTRTTHDASAIISAHNWEVDAPTVAISSTKDELQLRVHATNGIDGIQAIQMSYNGVDGADAIINGDLSVNGNIYGNIEDVTFTNITFNDILVEGSVNTDYIQGSTNPSNYIDLNGSVVIGSDTDLKVSGNTEISGNLTLKNSAFPTLSIEYPSAGEQVRIRAGEISVNGVLLGTEDGVTIAQPTSIEGDLTVDGTISNNGNTYIGGDLFVSGNTVTVNSMELSGNLHASGNTVLGDGLGGDSLTVNSDSQFNGNIVVTDTVNAPTISANDGVAITSPLTIGVGGGDDTPVEIITYDFKVGNGNFNAISMNAEYTKIGTDGVLLNLASDYYGGTYLEADGFDISCNTNIWGDLSVNGNITVESANIAGDVTCNQLTASLNGGSLGTHYFMGDYTGNDYYTVNHNIGNKYPLVQVIVDDQLVLVEDTIFVNENQLTVDLKQTKDCKVICVG